MMELAPIIEQYLPALKAKYGGRLLPVQLQAVAAMQRCRTPASGQMLICCHHCNTSLWKPHSCGHRSCPKCQHHEASQWLERQQAKLLPVEYFMTTFTLPYELRALAWKNQLTVYKVLFAAAHSTLKDFALDPIPDKLRRERISGEIWRKRLDYSEKKHSNRYGLSGIVQDLKPDIS